MRILPTDISGTLAAIVLIDPGRFDGILGDGLHGTREALHLAAIFCAGRRDMERQEMAPGRMPLPSHSSTCAPFI